MKIRLATIRERDVIFGREKKGSCRAPGVCIIRIYTERGRERKIIGQTLLFTHVIYFLLFPVPRNFISFLRKIIYFFHIFLFGVDVMFRQFFCCLKVLREIFDVDVPKCVHRRVFTPTPSRTRLIVMYTRETNKLLEDESCKYYKRHCRVNSNRLKGRLHLVIKNKNFFF